MQLPGVSRSAVAFLIVSVLLSLQSCKTKIMEEIIPSSKFAPYVSAYTGGGIFENSPIRIEFTNEHPDAVAGEEVKGKPFKFTPSLKGKTYWVNNKTLEFVPNEGSMKPDILYKASFRLGDFVEVEKDLQLFEFTFQVVKRSFTIDLKSLFIHASDPESVTVRGELRFSDPVSAEELQKIIKIKTTDNQPLTAQIDATQSPLVFDLTISNIKKGSTEIKLELEVDGKGLGVDKVVTREVIIPAKDVFSFLSANRIQEPDNGIEVIFSEPLSTSQDLKGLIELEGVSTQLQIKDNIVNVFFEEKPRDKLILKVNAGIESVTGKKLETSSSVEFVGEIEKPRIEMDFKGNILPDSKNLVIPFRAVSLRAVDISVIRIYESNVLTFLQTNTLDTSNELRRFGRIVYKKTIYLDEDKSHDLYRLEDYLIDLSGLIKQEQGAIYRIVLSFKQEYSLYTCEGEIKESAGGVQTSSRFTDDTEELDDAYWDTPMSYYYYEGEDYDWGYYDWNEQDNPCHPTYYMVAHRKLSCNVLATNLGLIVKRNSNNKLWVAVNNILDTSPVLGADVTAYNYQLQPIGTVKTDADGFGVIDCKGVPFIVVASQNGQKTYLKVIDGEEQSVSRFDVGGKVITKGLKGYVYGERGVWRPGDTLHISFIMEDRERRIPDKHPVSIELYNPQGQFYNKFISTNGVNGFYTFRIPVDAEAPTGSWNAYVKVGGASFHKALRIEAIKPNRLKINMAFQNEIIRVSNGSYNATLSSSWLTGATASNLKSKVEMKLSRAGTYFPGYEKFIFTNPASNFTSSTTEIFDGTLDDKGSVNFGFDVPEAADAPGMLRANLTARVFEPGGDASITTLSVPFSPFESYVGINLNQPDNRTIETDKDHIFNVVTVNADGKPTNRSSLEYKVYRVGWSWWWERRSESIASYINNSSYTPVISGDLKTVNGKASFKLRIDYPSWGRYLVYVKDTESGHATGGMVYIDWPEYRGRSDKSDPDGVKMLSFTTDKESYEAGETVTAIIPASSGGRALVAIENGTSVLHREWINVSAKEDTKYQFKITSGMAPNVYIHISLLQPHSQTANDLPIRLYGVMPILVTDKQTILEPQIKMPDVLRPEQEFSVTVSEKTGRAMTYTLAIVDDGLLDLTNFKTPNPWPEFYVREALGISTWDMYDNVIGAYAGQFGSLFSIGGDEAIKGADEKANRFRPVVKFLGPFTINKGESKTHKITLPMYVGSVRTMVVAGQDGAYGNAEKTTQVRTPLMLLSSLPRVLSTGEEIVLPVNVFAMENHIKEVTVNVETSDNLKLESTKKTITFKKTGDQLVDFKIKTGFQTGKEVVRITASGGGENTKETVEIDVRNPNPVVTLFENKLLSAGETGELSYYLGNNSRSNWVNLEVSRIPSVDFSRRLDYLYNYSHSCTEQIVSTAFPLLFVTMFKEVDEKELSAIKTNIQRAIRRLYERQLPNGGFRYWPRYNDANDWVSSYAGLFLVMANEKGYAVNPSVLSKWKSYQSGVAKSWTPPVDSRGYWYGWEQYYQQAYRLYTLALAGAPEQGAMNRMKEVKALPMQGKWTLAAAYALSGKKNIAEELIFNEETTVKPYTSFNNVFGSYTRDEAMILETLVLLGKDKEAFLQAQRISQAMIKQHYFDTQSTAYALIAMGRLAEKISGSIDFEWSLNEKQQTSVKSPKALHQIAISTSPLTGKVKLKNNGNGSLYVDLISRTQLTVDTIPAFANNLRIDVRYVDMNGAPIDIKKLKQGTDFKAIVKVTNTNLVSEYNNIALTHIIPSGWEIFNERMIGAQGGATTDLGGGYTYQDIRDDRVLTYFNIGKQYPNNYNNHVREITIRLQATYAGKFVLPAIQCEAMYDITAQGKTDAGEVVVER
jgi:uncharacterized protein YfaS (alpha-2-macroglobulin family)